jgi:hypothetical protein
MTSTQLIAARSRLPRAKFFHGAFEPGFLPTEDIDPAWPPYMRAIDFLIWRLRRVLTEFEEELIMRVFISTFHITSPIAINFR